ncbi:hypothetical protein ACCO45_008079 [Purpureocillium lilacinum]|uniref:Uncharacterized protein n=1 Tax=Purpureocillium lilacinum TaxID=33203 RepID=A0ACC4DMM2_PURLI
MERHPPARPQGGRPPKRTKRQPNSSITSRPPQSPSHAALSRIAGRPPRQADAHPSSRTAKMMSSTNEEDPFLQVQHSRRRAPLRLVPPHPLALHLPSSPELASARDDLESALGSLAEDLADLVASVQAIERDPAQFGISADEEVGGEIEDMREELNKKLATGGARRDDDHNGNLPDPNSFAIADGDDGEADGYAEFEQQQQVEMMREQDQHLDGVFQTVGNLRRQADDMGRELEEQGEMLDLVDEAADRVGGRLQTGMKKLQYVMRKNEDKWSSCCIAVLIFVLILLLVLLLIL